MSKSRLEKFLYALYSLDSSDLPKPLSRIEELYKCLVTGEEAPTFKPISRVEKYLMAILGAYDVNELPNPLSRVEVLLYKLATGDDNLDDIDSFLSEHEELLAEIIRNGGVGGNIDIEYVLHTLSTEFNTLYNTAEKPVKSAILKGNTKYRDIDTGDILDTFDETKNLELVSVKVPVLKVTGKNLFDGELEKGGLSIDTGLPNNNQLDRYRSKNYIKVKSSTKYVAYNNYSTSTIGIREFDEDYKFVSWSSLRLPNVFTTSNKTKYLKFIIINTNDDNLFQLEQGSTSTSYEPYKSNILTVNEPVELRGIEEVQDELNLMTGELTQRFEEVVLDGSEGWAQGGTQSRGFVRFYAPPTIKKAQVAKVISPNFPYYNGPTNYGVVGTENVTGVSYNIHLNVNIRTERIGVTDLTNSKQNIELFKQWLSNNPITVQYELETESVKTVDLSVVDQDGNDTKLSTFNDITHVTLSSEGLIPEVELGVATKNEEVLNTMSLKMDDISAAQTTLKETSNTQSENVDATMIATTEIYEELL